MLLQLEQEVFNVTEGDTDDITSVFVELYVVRNMLQFPLDLYVASFSNAIGNICFDTNFSK